jgi:hypothetical protein
LAGCFTCPNAVIPLEADTLARLLRMRDALSEAKARLAPDRWHILYAPKLEILERDVLPRFNGSLMRFAVEAYVGDGVEPHLRGRLDGAKLGQLEPTQEVLFKWALSGDFSLPLSVLSLFGIASALLEIVRASGPMRRSRWSF